MKRYSDLLDELLDLEEGLTEWEVEFVESLARKRRECEAEDLRWILTDKQRSTLMQIAEERL